MPASSYRTGKSGFTLLELAIVIVIIGLMLGGIIVGKYMMASSERGQVISQLAEYKSAVNQFASRFQAMPGDMSNAIDVWGAADPTPATCRTTQGTGTQTCNGDGDGQIDEGSEGVRAWQQLANAGLVSGAFSGVYGAGGTRDGVPGVSIPKSPLASSGFTLTYWTDTLAGSTSWYTDIGNVVMIGKDKLGNNQHTFWELLSPTDAEAIDEKIDDGVPGQGLVRANPRVTAGGGIFDYTPDCTTTTVASTSQYNIQVMGKLPACSLAFKVE